MRTPKVEKNLKALHQPLKIGDVLMPYPNTVGKKNSEKLKKE